VCVLFGFWVMGFGVSGMMKGCDFMSLGVVGLYEFFFFIDIVFIQVVWLCWC